MYVDVAAMPSQDRGSTPLTSTIALGQATEVQGHVACYFYRRFTLKISVFR